MNIIYIVPEAIYPVNTGIRVGLYNKIKNLSNLGHNIYLFSIVENEEEGLIQNENIKDIVEDSFFYTRENKKILNMLKSLFAPYPVASRTYSKMKKEIDKIISKNNIDIIFVETPQMANNIKNIKNIPMVLSLHNIEYLSMNSISNTINNFIKKMFFTGGVWKTP